MLRVLHVSLELHLLKFRHFLFSYTCTEVGGTLPKGFAIWKRTVSEKCCLHCDGTVYKDGLEMTPVDVGGVCDAVETSVCRLNPDTGKAGVLNEYHYKSCCPDDKGLI